VAVDRSGRIRAKWVGFDPDVERVMAAEEGRLVSVR